MATVAILAVVLSVVAPSLAKDAANVKIQGNPPQKSTTATLPPTARPSSSPSAARAVAATPALTATRTQPSNADKFGIAAGGGLTYLGYADVVSRLSAMKDLGIGWVRFDVDWSTVQKDGPNSYDWSGVDNVYNAAKTVGIKPLGIITYTPKWAAEPGCTDIKCQPASPQAFAAFARAAAGRYSSRGGHTWEIWNEPNGTDFWQPAPNPARYTQLLQASYRSIKATDASAIVLSGGLMRAGSSEQNYSPPDFLAAVYAQGGKGYFDAVSDHPYSYPYLASYQWEWNAWQQMSRTTLNLRGIMIANGDAAKQIWITEVGAPTGGPGRVATQGVLPSEIYDDHVTELLQAKIITDAVMQLKSYSWVGPFFWYNFQDNGINAANAENFYGLVRANGSRKPAYDAYKAAINSY